MVSEIVACKIFLSQFTPFYNSLSKFSPPVNDTSPEPTSESDAKAELNRIASNVRSKAALFESEAQRNQRENEAARREHRHISSGNFFSRSLSYKANPFVEDKNNIFKYNIDSQKMEPNMKWVEVNKNPLVWQDSFSINFENKIQCKL